MRIYMITVGEKNPDFLSRKIQKGLSKRHGIPVNKSHAALLVEGFGKWDGVWESLGDGFKGPKDPVKAIEGAEIRDKILLNIENPLQAIKWLREFVGTPYANLQYLLFVPAWVRTLARYFLPRFIVRVIKNGKMLSFCSESVAHFIRANCVGAFEDPDLAQEKCDEIDPVALVPIAARYGMAV